MSSHHVVRDEQEPAVLLLNPEAFQWDRLSQLMEWSPMLWVKESCLEKVLEWQLKIDGVIIPEASEEHWLNQVEEQLPLKIQRYEEDLNVPRFLKEQWQQDYKAFHILCSEAEAQQMQADGNLPINDMAIVFFTPKGKWLYSHEPTFKKWYPMGQEIHLKTEDQDNIIRTEKDGLFEIHQEGPFWLMEAYAVEN